MATAESARSNGLLLSEAVGDFLAEHDFSIIVSLDGSRENHDRNRVRPGGGGSFDAIMRRLRAFRARHPGFQRLAVSTCFDYRTDLDEMRKFFDAEKLFVVNIAQVAPDNTTYYEQFTDEDKRFFAERTAAFHRLYANAVKRGAIEKQSFLFSYVGVNFAQFAFHPVTRERRPAFLPYTACCIPGEKLYVTSDGKIHMCERINNKFPIGTLSEGLDYGRIAELIQNYNSQVCRRCAGCPVTRFCGKCFASVATDSSFEPADDYCAKARSNVKESLVRYVDIMEFRPDLLDDVTIDYHREILEKVGYLVE